jgi:hypothetical protein
MRFALIDQAKNEFPVPKGLLAPMCGSWRQPKWLFCLSWPQR